MDEVRHVRQQELARLMLQKAHQDMVLVQTVADSAGVADEIVGFHVQQAIEKSLKAVLTCLGIEYRYTHDLSVLYSQAEDAGVHPPGSLDDVEQFTDFAVQFRYALFQAQSLDRKTSIILAEQFLAWAQQVIESSFQATDS